MRLHRSKILVFSALACVMATAAAAQGRKGLRDGPMPDATGTYVTISGAISQFNYDREAEIEGFLLNKNTLVHVGPRLGPRIGMSMKSGDSVQVRGYAQTFRAGLQTLEAQSIQDRTSGKTVSAPEPGAAAPYSGSGRISQLNYGPDGAIDGFWLDNGTLATMPPFSANNPSSIRIGTTVAYSGYARTTLSGHNVVDVQSVSIDGQPLSLGAIPRGRVFGASPAPAPSVASAPALPPAPPPAGRADQPPPPPPPPQ